MKKELIDLFLSSNVVWLLRESLKRLKHTGFNLGLYERIRFLKA